MPNSELFGNLITKAKSQYKDKITWSLGGNAPIMGVRFFQEGSEVLLGARISQKLEYKIYVLLDKYKLLNFILD